MIHDIYQAETKKEANIAFDDFIKESHSFALLLLINQQQPFVLLLDDRW